MSQRRYAALLYGAAAFCFVTSTAAQGTKVGVIDLQGAILQTEDGMSASATMKNYMTKRQADLDRRQKNLQDEQNDLQKQSRVLSRRAIQRRTDHWQRRLVAVQTKFIEYNKQLQKKQTEFMAPMMQKMMQVIRLEASKRGFDVVVDRTVAHYARSDLDITQAVVNRYNSGGGVKGGGDAPAPEPK